MFGRSGFPSGWIAVERYMQLPNGLIRGKLDDEVAAFEPVARGNAPQDIAIEVPDPTMPWKPRIAHLFRAEALTSSEGCVPQKLIH